jgi:N-sulfoglucosamine sulfohydrolase
MRTLFPFALMVAAMPACTTDTGAPSPVAAPATAVPAPAANRPNILLIVSEDHGPELGCYGDPYARTPHLDRLAAEGMRFERAYVVQAGCSPSRAAIHTGRYAHQNGQVGLATWGFRLYREDMSNLPRSLKQAGYRTGIIGKLHVNPESAFPFDFKAIPSGNFARKDLPEYARNAGAFIAAGDEPFFLAVNYPDAHSPWQTQVDGMPAQPLGPDDIQSLPYFGVDTPELRAVLANHYNSVMRLDTLIGDLLSVLEAQGKADNTLVIFISDHGPDIIRGKRTVYEGGTHVPLIMRWPAGFKAGQTSRALVESTDLKPTLLELAGADPVPGLPGKSLLPLLRGEPVAWRQHLFTEFHTHAAAPNFNPQRALRNDRYKLIETLYPDEVNRNFLFTFNKDRYGYDSAVRAAADAAPHIRDTFQRMRIQPRYELYDLHADPYEFRNLADDPAHAEVFAELRDALTALRIRTGDPLLDPAILRQFRDEVLSLSNQRAARSHDWQYPTYFFPQDRAAAAKPTKQKREEAKDSGTKKSKKAKEKGAA